MKKKLNIPKTRKISPMQKSVHAKNISKEKATLDLLLLNLVEALARSKDPRLTDLSKVALDLYNERNSIELESSSDNTFKKVA